MCLHAPFIRVSSFLMLGCCSFLFFLTVSHSLDTIHFLLSFEIGTPETGDTKPCRASNGVSVFPPCGGPVLRASMLNMESLKGFLQLGV